MEQFIKPLGKKTALIYSDIYQCLCVKKELDADGAIFMKKLSELNLPNSPRVLEITDDYSLSVYINGLNLDEYIQQHGKCSAQLMTNIIYQIAKPLQIMHNQDMIHRDIKPGNIILDEHKHAYLIDFDTSRITKENQQHDTELLGTRGYASPEHFGFQSTDERSDIYSLGAVMKNCLDPRAISQEIEAICKKATSLDPADRYQNLPNFLSAFSQIGLYEENYYQVSNDSIDIPLNFIQKNSHVQNSSDKGQLEQPTVTQGSNNQVQLTPLQNFLNSPLLIVSLALFIIGATFMLFVFFALLQDGPTFATSLGYLFVCFTFSLLIPLILLLGDHLIKMIRHRKNKHVRYLQVTSILCLVGILGLLVAVVIEVATK